MTTFTNIFGGDNINPAYVSYAAFTSAIDFTLQWAFEATDNTSVAAAKMDVLTSVDGVSVTMPDASIVSAGTDVLFNNVGAHTFTVKGANGTTLTTVAPGVAKYLYLTGNSTADGVWRTTTFGAGTSTADAASLAGAGLRANVTLLDQNLLTQPKSANYSPVAGDRATVLKGTGGVVVYSPASAVTLGNGWFVYVVNAGSGTLTWTPSGGQTVDGAATKVLNPTESAIFFSDGTNFETLGYGRSIVSTVTAVSIDLSGSGTLTLNAAQAAAQVQDFTGTLTGARIVEYGTGVGYWFVRNNTSGAFSTTFRVNGADPGVAVTQGSFSILRSNGSTMSVAFSAAVGTVTSVATTANLTGGPITTSGTLDLSDTAVTPGTVGHIGPPILVPVVTVDQKGRVTAITEITAGTAASAATGTAVGNVPVVGSDGNLSSLLNGSTGDFKFNIGNSLPGWVLANGLTIGSGASAATLRANADTVNLYTLLWNSWADAQAPVTGGRGANAAADFAANKVIAVPDLRGRGLAGMDVIGASGNAARLSTAIPASTTPGITGGAQQSNTTVSSTGFNSFTGPLWSQVSGTVSAASVGTTPGGNFVAGFGDSVTVAGTNGNVSGTVNVAGTTANFNVVEPVMLVNPFLKL